MLIKVINIYLDNLINITHDDIVLFVLINILLLAF